MSREGNGRGIQKRGLGLVGIPFAHVCKYRAGRGCAKRVPSFLILFFFFLPNRHTICSLTSAIRRRIFSFFWHKSCIAPPERGLK